MNNKPQKYKETERFSIRRFVFWLSVAGIVSFASVWDLTGMVISIGVFLLTVVSKFISMIKEGANGRD